MTATLMPTDSHAAFTTPSALETAIDAACARIAPAWPLDRLIAVNPYWGFVGRPMEEAAADLAALAGTPLLMPRPWYKARWDTGRFAERHVRAALAQSGDAHRKPADVTDALSRPFAPPPVRALLTTLVDATRDLGHGMSWAEFVTRHISQTCAAFFDEGQAGWMPDRTDGLYSIWRTLAAKDAGPRLMMGLPEFRAAVKALPEDPRALVAEAAAELAVPQDARDAYFTALLMTVHGWASACAFRRWEARLANGDDDQIVHLLATRLAWEVILYRHGEAPNLAERWTRAVREWPDATLAARHAERDDWVLQRALELAWREELVTALSGASATPVARPIVPAAQAVFCIDVRSEVYRRALEAAGPEIQTLGFAGFFGLPIAYAPLNGPTRPQLPGLLAPAAVVRDAGAAREAVANDARAGLARQAAWKDLASTAGSAFSYVEVAGIGYAAALFRDGLGLGAPAGDTLRGALGRPEAAALRPELIAPTGDGPLALDARVRLAAGVLRAMNLAGGCARLVALIGHGAGTVNNPQAAGLHCGACGGQTGEVNARALAALLNEHDVRAGLAAQGIVVPATTHFVAGLHNTTTDDVTLFDLERAPASHRADIDSFTRRIADAGRRARAERAPTLGLEGLAGDALDHAVRRRAADWSEVRPEWGLAGNAAFVAAPRERTRGVNLRGRSFLHDYRWEQDQGFAVLELIMTAPMIVTHWINMQYYASTVDNHRYGSGNKVLHNVVGGRLGVFEGAGGDLRIGLALQSVHDGRDWVHEPLRLHVVIEAPAEAIDSVIAKHTVVRDLVFNEWLFLLRIDADGRMHQRRADGWHAVTLEPGVTA